MVVEAGEVVDRRLSLHDGEKPVALERERDLLRRGCDQVGVPRRELDLLGGDGEDAVDVRAETQRRDAELTHVEPRLWRGRCRAEDDGPEATVAISLTEWPVGFKKAVEGDMPPAV